MGFWTAAAVQHWNKHAEKVNAYSRAHPEKNIRTLELIDKPGYSVSWEGYTYHVYDAGKFATLECLAEEEFVDYAIANYDERDVMGPIHNTRDGVRYTISSPEKLWPYYLLDYYGRRKYMLENYEHMEDAVRRSEEEGVKTRFPTLGEIERHEREGCVMCGFPGIDTSSGAIDS